MANIFSKVLIALVSLSTVAQALPLPASLERREEKITHSLGRLQTGTYSFVVDFNSGLLSNMTIADDGGTELAGTAVGWKWEADPAVPNEMRFAIEQEADVMFTAVSEEDGSSFAAPSFDYSLAKVDA